MTVFEIPTHPIAQTFTVSLAGVSYQMTIRWCDPNQSWLLDISDSRSNPILQGIPLVTGSDLLGQFAYLGIGGRLIVQTDNNPQVVPTYTSLGVTGHLYFTVG